MARTAVIAGTATAVSNKVNQKTAAGAAARHQQRAAAHAEQENLAQMQEQLASLQAQQAMAAAPAAGSGMGDMIEKLQQLAHLKESGVLNEEEFAAAKARLLTS